MATVKSSRGKPYGTKTSAAEDEAPEHVLSEGEILIKEMVKKQLGTQLTLNQHLAQEKEFQTAVGFEPLTNFVCGQTTLREFESSTSAAAQKEDLQNFGLAADEIKLVLDWEQDKDGFYQKYKNVESTVLQSRLKKVNRKIEEAKAARDQFQDNSLAEKLSRHEQDLEAVKPDSEHSRLYQFALANQPTTTKDLRPLSHPINQLKHLEEELFGHLVTPPKKSKKKRKKLTSKLSDESVLDSSVSNKIDIRESGSSKRASLWDVTTVASPKPKTISGQEYTCKPEVLYTVRDNEIVPLNEASQTTSEGKTKYHKSLGGRPFVVSDTDQGMNQLITNQNLTMEEIRQIPRFAMYEPGVPSKVLYIKNLHNSTKEEDLVSLFSKFETIDKPRIVYRLLLGKMRGQAFITLPDINTASSAFTATNGSHLRGKPVIIQFGKQTD